MKSHDILYPQNQVTLCLKTGNLFQTDTDEDWFLKMKSNLFIGLKKPESLTALKPVVLSDPRPTSTVISSQNFLANNLQHEHSNIFKEPSKKSLAIPNISAVTLNMPHPTNENNVRPNLEYMTFMRPKFTDFYMAEPEFVSWTRIDRAQHKLDMIPTRIKVAMGVVAGLIATTTVHPLDVIKVRLQLFPNNTSTLSMLRSIMVYEGRGGLYTGLTAGILRQLTNTGSRLYVYNSLCDFHKKEFGRHPDFNERLQIAIIAGLVGAFMGTPSDMALVRMIEVWRWRCCAGLVGNRVKRPQRAMLELWRVARQEGVSTCWRGGVPTLIRSVFITSAQTGLYVQVRQAFTSGDQIDTGIKLHLCVATFSSLISALVSLPVDNVKSRYQSYAERKRRYKDILNDMLKKKGVRYLWKGFVPYFLRQVIHTVITYVVLDQLVDIYVELEASPQPKR